MFDLERVRQQFNNRINFREKRQGILQLIAPFYHEDGDMIDIYVQQSPDNPEMIRICDYGMTVQHLSYNYEINSPARERTYQQMIAENNLFEQDGNIYCDTNIDGIYSSIFQYQQAVSKISSMRYFQRETIKDLFLEQLDDYIIHEYQRYNPVKNYTPISNQDAYEVDYYLTLPDNHRPVYLYGITSADKARITAISCHEFARNNLRFNSIGVHRDFEGLPRKDRQRITNIIDKQFTGLEEFRTTSENYFQHLIH